jgi:hypothetical protein
MALTHIADEMVSLVDRLPDWKASHYLMAIFLIFRWQQVFPHSQVQLYPLFNVNNKAMDPHCGPAIENII